MARTRKNDLSNRELKAEATLKTAVAEAQKLVNEAATTAQSVLDKAAGLATKAVHGTDGGLLVKVSSLETSIAVILTKLEFMSTALTDLNHNVEAKYATVEKVKEVEGKVNDQKKILSAIALLFIAALVGAVMKAVLK